MGRVSRGGDERGSGPFYPLQEMRANPGRPENRMRKKRNEERDSVEGSAAREPGTALHVERALLPEWINQLRAFYHGIHLAGFGQVLLQSADDFG